MNVYPFCLALCEQYIAWFADTIFRRKENNIVAEGTLEPLFDETSRSQTSVTSSAIGSVNNIVALNARNRPSVSASISLPTEQRPPPRSNLVVRKFFLRVKSQLQELLSNNKKQKLKKPASSMSSANMRVVVPLDEAVAASHPDNQVINSRYTLWNFLPMNLYEQFRKPLNFYFLLVAALQFISIIAPVNPLSTLLPLLFAFSLTAAKEGYDDVKRHRQDASYNSKRYTCFDAALQNWKSVSSQQLRVGDVLKIQCNEDFPCDVVCIAAPEASEGTVYIRTDNLDGELDLKPKDVVPVSVSSGSSRTANGQLFTSVSPQDLQAALRFVAFSCPPPTPCIDSFDARRELYSIQHLERDPGAPCACDPFSLSAVHLVPQSTVLKHTAEVICVAVYTGNETKCGMNKHDPPVKWAKIDQAISTYAKLIFACQIVAAVVMGLIGNSMNSDTLGDGMWYLSVTPTTTGTRFLIYQLRFFLLTTVMIPVSFKFVVDLSKQMMALVLEWDLAMYNDKVGEGIKVRNSSIVEDLGQIEYVLSDKTGTMTQNQMVLKYVSVNGTRTAMEANGNQRRGELVSGELDDFFLCALLCNTVEVEHQASVDHPPVYHAASPDEEAICNGLAHFGYVLERRSKTEIVIRSRGVEHSFKVWRTFSFTSEKKCMGIVVEPMVRSKDDAGQVRVFVKGADDKLFDLASNRRENLRQGTADERIRELVPCLHDFAAEGLRTLVFASKWLSREEYNAFEVKYTAASNELEGRQKLCDTLELALFNGVDVLGVSAIEDKLQDDVKESIDTLIEANVRVWMLTGDKVETAEQIGLTCGLLNQSDVVVRLTADTDGQPKWREVLKNAASIYGEGPTKSTTQALQKTTVGSAVDGKGTTVSYDSDSDESRDRLVVPRGGPPTDGQPHSALPSLVLIVQGGPLLDQILGDTDGMLESFRQLSLRAKSVVCARVTPSQKAQITNLVRGCGFMTLAIGDGGNDVAMIQQAHVGVGICGKEGSQASRAADFSVSKFSHLRSLMLYHGHTSYARTAYVVQYSFYKSMLISFIQLVFNVFCTHMSGASFWNSFALTMWNGVYTLPQTLCYCLDRAAPRQMIERNPFLYRHTQRSLDFNPKTFAGFVLRGVLQSAALFWMATQATGGTYALPSTGQSGSHGVTFTLAYSALVLHQVATVVIESHSVTAVNIVVIVGMPVFYYLTIYIYASIKSFAYYGVFQQTDNIQGFLIAFAIAGALFLPHLAFSGGKAWWLPNARNAIRISTTMRHHAGSFLTHVVPPPRWRRFFKSLWVQEEPSLYIEPRSSTDAVLQA